MLHWLILLEVNSEISSFWLIFSAWTDLFSSYLMYYNFFYFLTLYTLQHSKYVPTCVWLFHLSSWHLFRRWPFSTIFLFISRNAMHTLRWRHCMLFCLLKTWCNKKNKWKVRDWKVRNNRFCQCIAVWSNFLRVKITHHIQIKCSPL